MLSTTTCSFKLLLVTAAVTLAGLSGPAHAADFYVAPNGSPAGTGSFQNPWDLKTALNHPSAVSPGDTIWLRGGTYLGDFRSRLNGAPGLPVTVRQYPGEHTILDGAGGLWTDPPGLRVEGSWTWLWGFEVTNSGPRPLSIARRIGVELLGPNHKLINMVVHDTGQGVSTWTAAVNAEIYGSILYNNGFPGGSRHHGHNVYTQNEFGQTNFIDNVMFSPFSYNLQAYGSSTAKLDHYYFEGNTFFNGVYLIGGAPPARDIKLYRNAYYRAGPQLGYSNQDNSDLIVQDNYVAGMIDMKWWSNAQVTGNTVYPVGQTGQDASIGVWLRPTGALSDYVLDRNTYIQGPSRGGWDFSLWTNSILASKTFQLWQAKGFDPNGSIMVMPGFRPSNATFVRPNRYEQGRANITIYNWELLPSVPVDLSGVGLKPGDQYELRNAQNYTQEIVTGTYNGTPLTIPMTGWSAALPVGYNQLLGGGLTFPEFGVFTISKLPNQGVSVNLTPPTVTLTTGQTQQFTSQVTGATNTGVTWSLQPPLGAISAAGLYTAPTGTISQTPVTITATSIADPTRADTSLVTLAPLVQPPAITVSITPATVTLAGGAAQQFTAQVTGAANTAVTWSIQPAVGTLSPSGLYTAPASISTQTTVTVKATSVADPTKAVTSSIALTPSTAVAVSIAPATVTLAGGVAQQFTSQVTGAANTAVTWSIQPAVGTLSPSGLYTAPASISTQTMVTVKATSIADTTKVDTSTIALSPGTPVTVTLNPISPVLTASQVVIFTAQVAGSTNTAVTWSIQPQVGTIATNGRYTAPSSIAVQSTVTVKATSAANPTISATTVITLTPGISVWFTERDADVRAGQSKQFVANVSGTADRRVTYKLSPNLGAISSTGLYTAPNQVAAATKVVLTATSVANPTKSGSTWLWVLP